MKKLVVNTKEAISVLAPADAVSNMQTAAFDVALSLKSLRESSESDSKPKRYSTLYQTKKSEKFMARLPHSYSHEDITSGEGFNPSSFVVLL